MYKSYMKSFWEGWKTGAGIGMIVLNIFLVIVFCLR